MFKVKEKLRKIFYELESIRRFLIGGRHSTELSYGRPLIYRVEELEKKNKMLMEYLNVVISREPEKEFIRKKNKKDIVESGLGCVTIKL